MAKPDGAKLSNGWELLRATELGRGEKLVMGYSPGRVNSRWQSSEEYATWIEDADGDLYQGHYHGDRAHADTDFAARSTFAH